MHAPNGAQGKGKDKNGAKGNDYILQVPCGTTIIEQKDSGFDKQVAELNTHGETFLLAKGGPPGRGNKNFPNTKEHSGGWGQYKKFLLEMQLIADIGFVGYPNAGKTTLLAALTRACPKIAAYPFTTLQPYVGKIHFQDGKS